MSEGGPCGASAAPPLPSPVPTPKPPNGIKLAPRPRGGRKEAGAGGGRRRARSSGGSWHSPTLHLAGAPRPACAEGRVSPRVPSVREPGGGRGFGDGSAGASTLGRVSKSACIRRVRGRPRARGTCATGWRGGTRVRRRGVLRPLPGRRGCVCAVVASPRGMCSPPVGAGAGGPGSAAGSCGPACPVCGGASAYRGLGMRSRGRTGGPAWGCRAPCVHPRPGGGGGGRANFLRCLGVCVSPLLCVCVVVCVCLRCASVCCVSALLLRVPVSFEPQDSPSLSRPPFQGTQAPVLGCPGAWGGGA